MAWKEDTFWENHPQTKSLPEWWKKAPRPRRGLRLKPRFRISDNLRAISLLAVTFIGIYIHPSLPRFPHLLPYFPTFMLALALTAGLVSAQCSRYYLFDAVTGRFVSRKPARRYDLLVRIASDPALMEHLGEPNWRQERLGLALPIPCGRFSMGASTFILALFLTLLLFSTVSMAWWGITTLIIGTIALMVVLYRRIGPSKPRGDFQGRGCPPDDSDRIPYDSVRAATLHWDRLLQREYLLLEHDGGTLRYYNFTGDPLYLLRLWKQRMPGALLEIGGAKGLKRGT